MARKRQIVSINFMSNFVFVGWKWNPGGGWCTVGGRTYWNSTRFVSQTCLSTQSHKHTCAYRPAATTADTQSWALLSQAGFPSQLFSPGLWSCSALLFFALHFLSACETVVSLLWTCSWISLLFFILSPHTCISGSVSLDSTNQRANIYWVLATTTSSPLFPSTLMVTHNKSSKMLFASCHFPSQ